MAKTAIARVATGAAIKSFGKAQGAALAENFKKTVQEQGAKLLMFLVNIVHHLDQEGRQAFRLGLQVGLDTTRKELKEMQAAIEAAKQAGAPAEQVATMQNEYNIRNKQFGSEKVRTSEATMFTRAVDKGWRPTESELKGWGYHRSIGEARNQAGRSNRGRQAKTADQIMIDAAKKCIEQGLADQSAMADILTRVRKEMKGWHKVEPEQPAAEQQNSGAQVEGTPDVRAVGPTQRKERKSRKAGDGFMPVKQPSHQAPAATH